MENHWHNSIEITYVVKGLKVQQMENKEVIAPAGTLNYTSLLSYHIFYYLGLIFLIKRASI